MIDYTKFALGVRVRQDEKKNQFIVGNPFTDKRLHIRLRPNNNWEDVFVEPMTEVVLPFWELVAGEGNNITVNINQTVHGVYMDDAAMDQMYECQKRSDTDFSSFHQIGASNVYVNAHGRKLERITVHGNITYREHKD